MSEVGLCQYINASLDRALRDMPSEYRLKKRKEACTKVFVYIDKLVEQAEKDWDESTRWQYGETHGS